MRAESVVRMLPRIARDVVLARRQLTAHPIFAATFALTMAIGIGANAAVFALVNGVFFKLPPVPEIDRVVHARARSVCKDGVCGPHSDWTSRVRSLRTIAPIGGYTRRQSSVSAAGRAGILSVKGVWGSYFSVLGVNPAVGRLLGPSDDDERSENAAVISDRVWRGWLGGREDVVGQRLTVGDRAFTIVGVVPPKFRGLDRSSVQPTDVWVPLRSEPPAHTPYFIGRLRPESTFEAAASEVRAATIGFDEARPGSYLEPLSLTDALRDFPQTYYAVAALALAPSLLIVCLAGANLTILLFARLSGRITEIATRLTLGATRSDITRMLAIEISILVLCGAAAGMWIAAVMTRYLQVPEFGGMHLSVDMSPDWRVFAYSLIIAGIAAALVIARVTAQVLEADGCSLFATTSGAGAVTFRSAGSRTRLIAFQTASVVIVLVLAGLFFRSALLGSAADPALDPDHAAAAWLDHDKQGYGESRAREVSRQVLQSALYIHGVRSAALISQRPGYAGRSLRLVAEDSGNRARAYVVVATEQFAEALGLTLVQGRRFNQTDTSRSAPVVIVSDRVAALLWPGSNPVGRWLRWDERTAGRLDFLRSVDASLLQPNRRVIGVVTSVAPQSLRPDTGQDIYVPMTQASVAGDFALVVRGSAEGSTLAGQLTARLRQTHPTVTLFGVGPLREQFGISSLGLKWAGSLLSSLGAIGATLALVGLFGVIAHTAAVRRREFGIMRALGATEVALCRQAALEGLRILLIGIAPALVVSLLAARMIRFHFLGFRWLDWQTLFVVPSAVLLFGLVACVLPVCYVLRQSPLTVLRDP